MCNHIVFRDKAGLDTCLAFYNKFLPYCVSKTKITFQVVEDTLVSIIVIKFHWSIDGLGVKHKFIIMEINKQLFEDVLSGKLKGMFILRNGTKINMSDLKKNVNGCMNIYPYRTKDHSYTAYGYAYENSISNYDIINFIPTTNMKANELTIKIPKGKIIDWEESKKQNKIVLKDKQLTYEEICDKLGGMIDIPLFGAPYEDGNALVANKHQLECILAKNKLANVAVYLNNGWKPSKTDFGLYDAWVLYVTPNKDYIGYMQIVSCTSSSNVLFKSSELALQAIEILGEETVKLALEPLGI